ncbi:PMP-22/EMP/MP20/Claudin tight junction [Fasciolopsis buskii]|uniref:PMP-22/EMP/MP20/Claudin tight junction n=1 Tax=Fasciolopsis buskii TaxID=27845 RepID=A0A8E0RUT2_9TREM|nr:PMP-22/EMP/MP20/Claudin tight junction [Fasciolopsis buski]
MAKDYRLTQMYMPFYAACVATTIGFLFFFLSFSSPYWLQSYDRVHSSFLHMGIWSVCFDRFVHPQDYHANVLTGCYWIFDPFFFKIGIWQWLDPAWLVAVQVLITIAFITQCCVILILVLYHLLYGHPAAESTMAMAGQEEVERFEAVEQQYGLTSVLSGRGGTTSAMGRSLYGGTQSIGGVVVKVPSTGARPAQVLTLDSDLRRMDGSQGTASLFSRSASNQPYYQSGRQGAPLSAVHESQHSGEEQNENDGHGSNIPSTYQSDGSRQPVYTNDPRQISGRTGHRGHLASSIGTDENQSALGSQLSYSSQPSQHNYPKDYSSGSRRQYDSSSHRGRY